MRPHEAAGLIFFAILAALGFIFVGFVLGVVFS